MRVWRLWTRRVGPDCGFAWTAGLRELAFSTTCRTGRFRQVDWSDYVLEGAIADDATNIAFRLLAARVRWWPISMHSIWPSTTVTYGRPFRFAIRGSKQPVRRALPNGFRPVRPGAHRSLRPRTARQTANASFGSWQFRDRHRTRGRPRALTLTLTLPKASGLECRITLSDTDARTTTIESVRAAINEIGAATGRSDLDVRLADVVVAWNVLRHFYPYGRRQASTGTPGSSRSSKRRTDTREAHRRSLQQLVADARDGHGNVVDTVREPSGTLPIRLRPPSAGGSS